MPAVCRFFLKGYCRYGRNCRFEHPGENNDHQSPPRGGGGFSFTKALEEVSSPDSPQVFSFTRALQATDTNPTFGQQQQQQYNQNTSYFAQNQYQQHYSPFQTNDGNYFNNNNNNNYNYQNSYAYEQSSPYRQQYNQQSTNNTGSFSFTQALNFSSAPQGPFNSSVVPSFGQLPGSQFSNNEVEIVMRGSDPVGTEKESQLTDIEIKAYQSDKFTFRLIPIRPPPQYLCH